MDGNSWFVRYRQVGGSVQLQIHAAKFGVNIVVGDIVATLPSNLKPALLTPILFVPKNVDSTLNQGYGAIGFISNSTGTIAIAHTFNDNPENTQTSGGSQDYWANMVYTLG